MKERVVIDTAILFAALRSVNRSTRRTLYQTAIESFANDIEAHRLWRNIDENDTSFIALSLELNVKFWSKDELLKNHLISLGFDRFFADV